MEMTKIKMTKMKMNNNNNKKKKNNNNNNNLTKEAAGQILQRNF